MSEPLRVLVVTVSDRASRGEYDDRSGPAVEEAVLAVLSDAQCERIVVPDEAVELIRALDRGLTADAVLTTGGTGIGPRDITPETTEAFCDRPIPGIAEYLRLESLKETKLAPLSRGFAGQKGDTVIVNLPGSVKGAASTARLVAPLLEHARSMLAGEGH